MRDASETYGAAELGEGPHFPASEIRADLPL
jgi:hypothetical protein